MTEPNSPRIQCPCGFYGSPQTLGLCSKCYKEREQNRNQTTADMVRPSMSSSNNAESVHSRISAANSSTSALVVDTSNGFQQPCGGDTATPSISHHSDPAADASADQHSADSTANCRVATDTVVTEQRGQKRKCDDEDDDGGDDHATELTKHSPAKRLRTSTKHCHMCNCRLQLAVTEIGKCKCGSTFCLRHRLPEQHNCTFDHKEEGRREARAKMVPARKHVGTTLKRLDSDL